ncbi:chemotaxis protein CheD [Fundidesulfovibrio agrisoli]|uniref:chemotaxis protein CheD n=1 Tax=Fundidesulfovibrio agrisoli TaxID=2922717 RepID=UPI001FAC32F7|nr:chemotaxis protein CheD [Fundidesulfovibrio agrisoli]
MVLREMQARHPDAATEYLKVAEGGLFMSPTIVQTVLGSCLSGVFYSPARRAGAIFHAFLPYRADYNERGRHTVFKYVDTAIAHMVEQFRLLGVRPGGLRVALVGGANGMVSDDTCGVGRKNADCALEVCRALGLRPESMDLGGAKGRKVFFETHTGELHVHPLSSMPPA